MRECLELRRYLGLEPYALDEREEELTTETPRHQEENTEKREDGVGDGEQGEAR